jgi:hypothetical protein
MNQGVSLTKLAAAEDGRAPGQFANARFSPGAAYFQMDASG